MNSDNKYWDDIYDGKSTTYRSSNDTIMVAAMNHFGDIKGKTLLDIGCGNGSTSVFFAEQGANVIAVDISKTAINNLMEFCQINEIKNIRAVNCSAFEITSLKVVDFVFGSMILHHLEPFDEFAVVLRQTIKHNGKAFFYENNGFSDLLIWCRNNLVGRFGIPQYGHEDEFPLLPHEINSLRKYFSVKIFIPELFFFKLASIYLFKNHFMKATTTLDSFLFKFNFFKRYSYRQYLMLS